MRNINFIFLLGFIGGAISGIVEGKGYDYSANRKGQSHKKLPIYHPGIPIIVSEPCIDMPVRRKLQSKDKPLLGKPTCSPLTTPSASGPSPGSASTSFPTCDTPASSPARTPSPQLPSGSIAVPPSQIVNSPNPTYSPRKPSAAPNIAPYTSQIQSPSRMPGQTVSLPTQTPLSTNSIGSQSPSRMPIQDSNGGGGGGGSSPYITPVSSMPTGWSRVPSKAPFTPISAALPSPYPSNTPYSKRAQVPTAVPAGSDNLAGPLTTNRPSPIATSRSPTSAPLKPTSSPHMTMSSVKQNRDNTYHGKHLGYLYTCAVLWTVLSIGHGIIIHSIVQWGLWGNADYCGTPFMCASGLSLSRLSYFIGAAAFATSSSSDSTNSMATGSQGLFQCSFTSSTSSSGHYEGVSRGVFLLYLLFYIFPPILLVLVVEDFLVMERHLTVAAFLIISRFQNHIAIYRLITWTVAAVSFLLLFVIFAMILSSSSPCTHSFSIGLILSLIQIVCSSMAIVLPAMYVVVVLMSCGSPVSNPSVIRYEATGDGRRQLLSQEEMKQNNNNHNNRNSLEDIAPRGRPRSISPPPPTAAATTIPQPSPLSLLSLSLCTASNCMDVMTKAVSLLVVVMGILEAVFWMATEPYEIYSPSVLSRVLELIVIAILLIKHYQHIRDIDDNGNGHGVRMLPNSAHSGHTMDYEPMEMDMEIMSMESVRRARTRSHTTTHTHGEMEGGGSGNGGIGISSTSIAMSPLRRRNSTATDTLNMQQLKSSPSPVANKNNNNNKDVEEDFLSVFVDAESPSKRRNHSLSSSSSTSSSSSSLSKKKRNITALFLDVPNEKEVQLSPMMSAPKSTISASSSSQGKDSSIGSNPSVVVEIVHKEKFLL